jgi:hypothetical protein
MSPLSLAYEVLTAEGDPEQALVLYVPEPASPSEEALTILASWATSAPLPDEARDSTG